MQTTLKSSGLFLTATTLTGKRLLLCQLSSTAHDIPGRARGADIATVPALLPVQCHARESRRHCLVCSGVTTACPRQSLISMPYPSIISCFPSGSSSGLPADGFRATDNNLSQRTGWSLYLMNPQWLPAGSLGTSCGVWDLAHSLKMYLIALQRTFAWEVGRWA